MRFDDSSVDASQLEDRRGRDRGAGLAVGRGGLGIVGLLLVRRGRPECSLLGRLTPLRADE